MGQLVRFVRLGADLVSAIDLPAAASTAPERRPWPLLRRWLVRVGITGRWAVILPPALCSRTIWSRSAPVDDCPHSTSQCPGSTAS